MANAQFTLTKENLQSIARGLLINVAGAALLTASDWLAQGEFNWTVLKVSLGTAIGAAIVNTVRKYFSPA